MARVASSRAPLKPALVSRFAPSPTGRLHLGHAYSAVLAHDLARRHGGQFVVRIEDIDQARCREVYVDAILDDLSWLGLRWDGPVIRQSVRLPVYAAALDRLRDEALLYPCFCTRRDIAESALAPHGSHGPIYSGKCRGLAEAERMRRMAHEPHCWRLDVAAAIRRTGALAWHDRRAGSVTAAPLLHGDVVLARKDAPVAYHLAVTIDDAAQGVTDVVRGIDLFRATDIHRLLQALLDLPTPRYAHHALLADEAGRRLAKRDGARSLAAMRAEGQNPAALLARLRAQETGIGSAPVPF